ncbi:MAG: IPT/TIG domain-containing protein [Actinobacteria bacterium]|nr:IPT/TIG domain-containing protein [Actinomycetota bacterium]
MWTETTPKSASSGPGQYNDVFFLNEQQGWVVGHGEIAFTRDGGFTWQQPLPSNMVDRNGNQRDPATFALSNWQEVRFVDDKNGWILGAGVFRTTDGGHHWREEKLPYRLPSDYPEFEREEVTDLALSAVKDPPGHPAGTVLVWVTAEATGRKPDGTLEKNPDGTLKSDRALLLSKKTTTTTSGEPWSVVDPEGPGGSDALLGEALQFFDERIGLATTRVYTGDGLADTEDGAIFATTDGGRNWTLDQKNPNVNLGRTGFNKLSFTDPTHGSALWYNNDANTKNWGANSNGAGGRTWRDQTASDCLTTRVAVGVADGRNCAPPKERGCNRLTTGFGAGNISRTTDGGATWVPMTNPDPTPLAYARFTALFYPTPTVAYVAGKSDRRKIFKGSITFVKVTNVEVAGTGKAEGLLCGGTEVTITGDHFYPEDQANGYGASRVFFGSREAEVVSVDRNAETEESDDTMVVRAPPGVAPGPVDVIVKTPGLGESRPLQKQFTYVDTGLLPPVIRTVHPPAGKLAGGETLTISGERLGCAVRVDFRDPRTGKVEGFDKPRANPDGTLTVNKVPRWSHDPTSAVDVRVDVVVTSAGLAGLDVPSVPASPAADDYTYLGLPAVSGVNPPRGPAFGGTSVTIAGTGFEGANEVLVDGVPLQPDKFRVESPTRITATVPPHAPGAVPIRVGTPGRGASTPPSAPQFTYHPGISGISPPGGLTTERTEVTIEGKGFAGTTEVRFGNQRVEFTEVSDTNLVAFAPPHEVAEAVRVQLVASRLSSLPEDVLYTYGAPAIVDKGPEKDVGAGPPKQETPPPQVAPPGGTGSPAPGGSPSPSPSPSPSASSAQAPSQAPSSAKAPSPAQAPSSSPVQAPAPANAPVGASVPAPGAAPVAAPGAAAGQGAPGSGQGAVGSDDAEDTRGARRYAMTDAQTSLAVGAAGAVGCFSWLALARRGPARRRRTSAAVKARPKGAY